jgi:glutamyl-tRNA reductase
VRPEAHRVSPAAGGAPVRRLTGVRGALAAAVDGSLLAVGISHRTATVALREQAALTEPAARALLGDLRSMPEVTAAVVLSTCNRTELYALSAAPDPIEPLRGALAARGRLSSEAVAAAGYDRTGAAALEHLFRVAAGLDSLVVGEPEIQHQVRRAAGVAADEGMLGPGLEAVFRAALAAGRRVRRETAIGRGAVSTASVCIALARDALGDLSGRDALVVGAGAMAASAGRALRRNGAGGIVVANRTAATARRLAGDLGGRGIGLDEVAAELARVDLVVACTAAPDPVLRRAHVARVAPARGGRPLVCIDLALPGDIDPAVADLDGVVLLDIDDLRGTAEANRAERALEARRAEAIVAGEVARCLRGRRAGPAAPLATAA